LSDDAEFSINELPLTAEYDLALLEKFIRRGALLLRDQTKLLELEKLPPPPENKIYGWSVWHNLLQMDRYFDLCPRKEWCLEMVRQFGADDFHTAALHFLLHYHSLQPPFGGSGVGRFGLLRMAIERMLTAELFDERPENPIFGDRERFASVLNMFSLFLAKGKDLDAESSYMPDPNNWRVSREGMDTAPLVALCRQLVKHEVWLDPAGVFSAGMKPPAKAYPLKVPYHAEGWYRRLRALLIDALRNGWMTQAEVEDIVSLHPILDPWWLLTLTEEQREREPPAVREFAARVRRGFAGKMRALFAKPDVSPTTVFSPRTDILESHFGWAVYEYRRYIGSEPLLVAAEWFALHSTPKEWKKYQEWTNATSFFSTVSGLSAGEDPAEVEAQLAKFPRNALAGLLPWSGKAQPIVLRAMGLGHLEKTRQWLVKFSQPPEGSKKSHEDALPVSDDPADGVADIRGARDAFAGTTAKERSALAKMYHSGGLFKYIDDVVAAIAGDADRAKLRERAVVKMHHQSIKLYGMLPSAGDDDVRERYVDLQRVYKEASKHGAQRQASQRAAALAALSNLAQAGGFNDSADLEWTLELNSAQVLAPFFAPAGVGDYKVWVEIDSYRPQLRVQNAAGKLLASPPPAIKRDPAFVAIRETFDETKEQLRRFMRVLETRMKRGTAVPLGQIEASRAHPVMAPIVASLVWIDDAGNVGLLRDGGLAGPHGTVTPQGTQLRVAHSVDVLDRPDGAAALAAWQRWLVSNSTVQPFKQMFREIYVPTPAELEADDTSQRYAHRTLRTGPAQGILQSRNWMSLGEFEGSSQKLDLGGGVLAMCEFTGNGHYFTEQATCETGVIVFWSGAEKLRLADVPKAGFSEAMRDIDLLVTVAGTDGGESYYSAAVISSRAELLQALEPAIGTGKMEFQERHVLVHGKLADYRVHLASGNIHVEPGAYLCIVPDPVVAAQRKSVRLPFAEDDIKTAEIVSKVMLLAHDDKIKDQSILQQIRAHRSA
jgi:uncharacterized protein DUF4132/uncharacterized protein DUF5724